MRIDIWSDIVCPWCYVGKRRFERALAAFEDRDEVQVVHRSFQLDPTRPKGQTQKRREMLMTKYRLTVAQVEALDARMEQTAAAEGLEYHLGDGVHRQHARRAPAAAPGGGPRPAGRGARALLPRLFHRRAFALRRRVADGAGRRGRPRRRGRGHRARGRRLRGRRRQRHPRSAGARAPTASRSSCSTTASECRERRPARSSHKCSRVRVRAGSPRTDKISVTTSSARPSPAALDRADPCRSRLGFRARPGAGAGACRRQPRAHLDGGEGRPHRLAGRLAAPADRGCLSAAARARRRVCHRRRAGGRGQSRRS